MSDGFDLDLRNAESELDAEEIAADVSGRVVLGVLDGTTPPEEWIEIVQGGSVCLLAIEGDLNELAAPFAGDIHDDGGTLTHFRDFLVVAPPGIDVDTDRL